MLHGKGRKLVGVCVALALVAAPMVWLVPPASAQTTFSNAASIALDNPTSSAAQPAGTYPSTISASGLTGNISNITVTLSGINYSFLQDLGVLLVGPAGGALSLFTAVGPNNQSTATSGLNVTLDDAGTKVSFGSAVPTSGSTTIQPADFSDHFPGFSYDTYPSPAPGTFEKAEDTGSATLGTTFDGTNPNGTWKLYVTTNSEGDGTGSIAGGWSLSITTAATLAATTTSLTSNPGPSFTSGTNSSVTLSAAVTSSGSAVTTGTVDFADGGTTISGCGAATLSASGDATCTTTFTTEGDHALTATYSGTTAFVASVGDFTQEVDNHTVVSGNNFANTGALDIPNAVSTPGDATVYPSHVFVSGLSGTIADVQVNLDDINYPFAQDLDLMLVGPGAARRSCFPASAPARVRRAPPG